MDLPLGVAGCQAQEDVQRYEDALARSDMCDFLVLGRQSGKVNSLLVDDAMLIDSVAAGCSGCSC